MVRRRISYWNENEQMKNVSSFQERTLAIKMVADIQSTPERVSTDGSHQSPGSKKRKIQENSQVSPFQVHYFEDGNVQLVSSKEITETIQLQVKIHFLRRMKNERSFIVMTIRTLCASFRERSKLKVQHNRVDKRLTRPRKKKHRSFY